MEIPVLSEFTPIPFWFWNDELSEEEILRQMKEMKDKGVDGFVIHPRKGLPSSIGYLSDEYFRFVKFAVKKACEMDMKVVLYDEAMYPSGSCHGEVVKSDPSFASMGLERRVLGKEPDDKAKEKAVAKASDGKAKEKVVAKVIEDGNEVIYVMTPSGGTIRGVHPGEDDGEVLAPKSADLLNPKAVAKFVELTHEKYYAELSEYFGNTVIAFFTDEPNILGRNARENLIPWSDGLYEEFKVAGGTDEDLKLLFAGENHDGSESSFDNGKIMLGRDCTLARRATCAKRIYEQVIHNRLSNSYYKQLSDWCASHGIDLTGHPEKSTDIGYLKYFQRPCQDIVWRFVEPEDGHAIEGEHSTMGKCSSDSARHRGKRRNGNECFGCCGERQDPKLFTEKDMRWYLNWLFVRGVNLVYPHAFYYSLRGDRGDERPPEVGMNNPFWPEYRKMSDFVKRMCYLNTDSVNCAQVAILCGADTLSWKLAKPLFTNQIEFNYLEAELLEECEVSEGKLCIAAQKYQVLLADKEELDALGERAKEILSDFAKASGRVIVAGEEFGNQLSSSDEEFIFIKNERELLNELEKYVRPELKFDGDTYDLRCSHIRKNSKDYLMLTNEGLEPIRISWKDAEYRVVELWNPYTLERKRISEHGEKLTIQPCDLWVMELSNERGIA